MTSVIVGNSNPRPSLINTRQQSMICAEQAFCAGGDVKATVQQIMKGDREQAPKSVTSLPCPVCHPDWPCVMHAQAHQHLRPLLPGHLHCYFLCFMLCAFVYILWTQLSMPQILHARVHHEQSDCQVPKALHLAAGWDCDGRRSRRLNPWLLQSSNRKVSFDSSEV